MSSFLSSASPTQEQAVAEFAIAVVDPNQNIYNPVAEIPDDKTVVTASCFCHSGYLTFGSRYYVRNPQVDPGDAFGRYDECDDNGKPRRTLKGNIQLISADKIRSDALTNISNQFDS
jgi:hypothetical protein